MESNILIIKEKIWNGLKENITCQADKGCKVHTLLEELRETQMKLHKLEKIQNSDIEPNPEIEKFVDEMRSFQTRSSCPGGINKYRLFDSYSFLVFIKAYCSKNDIHEVINALCEYRDTFAANISKEREIVKYKKQISNIKEWLGIEE